MQDETPPGGEPPAETPKYDQEFFLALALQGKEKWNEWRHDPANEDVRVTFEGVDFSNPPRDKIDFSGFEFGNEANFSKCKWRGAGWKRIREIPEAFKSGRAFFAKAIFGYASNFSGATLGDCAVFTGVNFGRSANFLKTKFGVAANFIGATIGEQADFTGAVFGEGATFTGAVLGPQVFFTSAAFGGLASFTGTSFGFDTNFVDARFGYNTDFTGSMIDDQADFTRATFTRFVNFGKASFGDRVSFNEATFNGLARFTGAAFGSEALFSQADFNGEADFTGMSKEQWRANFGPPFPGMAEEAFRALIQRHEESWERRVSGPDRFLRVWFSHAHFDDEVSFSDRSFVKHADFSRARFYYAPNLDWTGNFAQFDFKGAQFGLAPSGRLFRAAETKLPSLLRAMRRAAEEARDHDLERDLYIAERKAELGINQLELLNDLKKVAWIERPLTVWRLFSHMWWVVAMFFYWALANYGRSFLLPLAWFGLSVPLFYWAYGVILAPLVPLTSSLAAAKYARALWMVALGNAVPFVGPLTIDADIKKFLFCTGFGDCLPMPPPGYQLLVLFQNLLSIILVFFIGLAVRNYFKIK
jgi:hypothetical protein